MLSKNQMAMIDLRDACKSMQPHCPACGTNQVQLTYWYRQPVKFRCRHCKCKFEVTIDFDSVRNTK